MKKVHKIVKSISNYLFIYLFNVFFLQTLDLCLDVHVCTNMIPIVIVCHVHVMFRHSIGLF